MTEIINSYDAVLRSWIEIVRYDILIQTLVADIQNSVIYLSDKIECTESDNNNNNKVDRCLARYSPRTKANNTVRYDTIPCNTI